GCLPASGVTQLHRSVPPDQEEAGLSGIAARKIEHACRQVKATRLQIALPTQVNLGRLAAQGFGPVCQRRVDRPSMIGAQLRRKTQQHKLLLAACRRFSRTVKNRAPVLLADMVVDQLADAPVALLGGGTAHLVSTFDLAMFEVGGQLSKIGNRQKRLQVARRGPTRCAGCCCIVPMPETVVDRSNNICQKTMRPGSTPGGALV